MPYDYTRVLLPYQTPHRSRRPLRAVLFSDDGITTAQEDGTLYQDATITAFVARLLTSAGSAFLWLLHSPAGYEMNVLLDAVTEATRTRPQLVVDVISQGRERVIGLKFRQGHRSWELRNSAAVLPVSREELIAALASGFDTTTAVGLLAALVELDALIRETFYVGMGWTAGATALRAWRATLPDGTAYLRTRPTVERFCREAYYGGYTLLASTATHADTVTLDVNSMYPYVMRACGVPVGTAAYTERRILDAPGFYRVRASVPKAVRCPVLPYRADGGVVYPTGDFTTTATSDELDMAERQGARITVEYGYVFRGLIRPFTAFVTYCEQVRRLWRGQAQERLAKILQASLYGKFGARPTIERYALFGSPPEDRDMWHPMVDVHTGEVLDCLYWCLETLEAPYLRPEWAAWITAQARLYLLRAMHAIGPEHILYADTDSVTASRRALGYALARGAVVIGSEYGQWKIEREYRWFRAGQVKHYQGALYDGRMVDRAAGIMREAVVSTEHTRALDGETIQADGMTLPGGVRVLKGHTPGPERMRRQYPIGDPGRTILPPHLQEGNSQEGGQDAPR